MTDFFKNIARAFKALGQHTKPRKAGTLLTTASEVSQATARKDMERISRTFKSAFSFFASHRVIILFSIAIVFAGTLHGYNMFHYPYYESDEGTYMAQAFSVKENGELSQYVYWYDHPPFGWITLASWVDLLNDDWNFFGNSTNTGRVFMLLLHILQVSLIFFLVHRTTKSPWLALFAIVLYSTSPLGSYFQRRVLLDNLLTTWVLLSVSVLHIQTVKLRHVLMSGVFFGLAVITKITTVMFGLPILYLLLTAKWQVHKGFRTLGWLLVAGSVTSIWIFYALIKTEFFPAPNGERVSLLGSIQYQASRGTGSHFWESTSSFMDNLVHWHYLDAMHVYIIGLGLLTALAIAVFSKRYRFFGLATVFYFIFLIRGGVVIGFYLLPMLPFIAISLVLGMHIVTEKIRSLFPKAVWLPPLLFLILIVSYGVHYAPKVAKYLTVDETSNQNDSVKWIKENIPEDAKIIVDINAMTELINPGYVNDKVFSNADWYFKVAKDPAIRYTKYRDDWRNFDYVLISHEMLYQARIENLPVVYDAIRNSEPVIKWDKNSTAFVDIQNFLSTNGDWVALYRVNSNTRTQLLYSWNYFKDNFIESYGQVVDPQTGITTSEGQSYAMLRSAFMNDEDAFKGIWLWTQHHFQHRNNDSLLSWRWEDGEQTDSTNATDADIDIALALIFASRMFDNPTYLEDAQKIIEDIWSETVVSINGRYYLLPSEKTVANRGEYYLLNPSYFSPAHYRIFAEVDPERKEEWLQLADDSYTVLREISKVEAGNVGLPMNWVMVHSKSGLLSSAENYITQGEADYFGYDAFRTLWRVGLDASWYETEESIAYLTKVGGFFESEWSRRGSFGDVYTMGGVRVRSNQNLAIASGILSAMKVSSDSQVSADVYNTLFVDKLVLTEEDEYAYWGDPTNYYDSNWVWFGMALFNDNLPNVWEIKKEVPSS